VPGLEIVEDKTGAPDQVNILGGGLATSAFQGRGLELKSSDGANWVGLTKIETMSLQARRFATRISDTWPSWSAPMVGTSAVVAFRARRLSKACRDRADDHGASRHPGSISGGQGGSRLAGLRRDADLIKADGRPPSGRSTSANRGGSSRARQTASVAVPRARFMIKADDQRFANAIAHFT
jgi:hypothetical protein